MDHNAPHTRSAFEGYYNKFSLPSGANLVVVVCKINGSPPSRSNKVSFTYVPPDASKIYQREIFPHDMTMTILDQRHGFMIDIPKIGSIKWNSDSTAQFHLEHDSFVLHARTTTRIPWSTTTNTPEGVLAYLPLPLHWHVHSLASDCVFDMNIPGYQLPESDISGKAVVHQEKNYASSFPFAHMWVQARDGQKGICLAGGQILGMEAFLLGYRSSDLEFDFRPPFAMRFLGLGPFMTFTTDWETRTFTLSIQSFRRKISIHATAPKGSFFSLSPPFPEGHRENFLGQSFQATVHVKIYESGWFSPWRLRREDFFQNASLEFGAGYYPPAGSKMKFN